MNKVKEILHKTERGIGSQKAVLFLLGVYIVSLLSLLRANYSYIDDMGRAAYGYTGWEERFSRYLSTFSSYVLHAGKYLSDISPLPQIIAVCIMIFASTLLLYTVTGKKRYTIWELIAVIPMGLSPYFLECFSYKYDAPYMALSVLVSIVPILLIKKKNWIYVLGAFICSIAMCTSYQASSGIFPMIVVLLSFLGWNRGEKIADLGIFIVKSAVGYLLGILFYQFFLMKPAESYVSNSIASPKEIIKHYITYFELLYNDLKKIWLVFIGIICICFIICMIKSSRQKKIVAFFVSIFTITFELLYNDLKKIWLVFIGIICICFIICMIKSSRQKKIVAFFVSIFTITTMAFLSWGLYPALSTPLTAPRAMYGFCVFISLISLSVVSITKKQYLLKFVSLVLSWCFIIFSLTYGNALVEQEKYADFRIETVIQDLNNLEIFQLDSEKKIQITGTIGWAPIIRNKPQHYRILNRLVPITFQEKSFWGDYKLLHYYGVENLVRDTSIDLTVLDLPKVRDTMYHNIYADKNNVLIELK